MFKGVRSKASDHSWHFQKHLARPDRVQIPLLATLALTPLLGPRGQGQKDGMLAHAVPHLYPRAADQRAVLRVNPDVAAGMVRLFTSDVAPSSTVPLHPVTCQPAAGAAVKWMPWPGVY